MVMLEDGALLSVRCDDLPWQPSALTAGLSVRNVAVAGGLELQLVRMAPGARIPPHKHELPEFVEVRVVCPSFIRLRKLLDKINEIRIACDHER